MARVECAICKTNVDTLRSNYAFVNGIHQHLKCPKKKVLDDEENEQFKELNDAIDYAHKYQKHKRADWESAEPNWTLVGRTVKALKKAGFTYKDQLYALNYTIEKDGGYWGYGRLKNTISEALAKRDREKQYEAQREKYEAEKKSKAAAQSNQENVSKLQPINNKQVSHKPSFLNVGDDDLDWM